MSPSSNLHELESSLSLAIQMIPSSLPDNSYYMRLVSLDTKTCTVRIRLWGGYCSHCGTWERWVCEASKLQSPHGAYFVAIKNVYKDLKSLSLVTQLDSDFYQIKATDTPLFFDDPPDATPAVTSWPSWMIRNPSINAVLQELEFHPFVRARVLFYPNPDGLGYGIREESEYPWNTVLMYKGGHVVYSWRDLAAVAPHSHIVIKDIGTIMDRCVRWDFDSSHKALLDQESQRFKGSNIEHM